MRSYSEWSNIKQIRSGTDRRGILDEVVRCQENRYRRYIFSSFIPMVTNSATRIYIVGKRLKQFGLDDTFFDPPAMQISYGEDDSQ